MENVKTDIITVKVPEALSEALSGIPNRSEFIRNAIRAALDQTCPLCKGSGFLLPHQKQMWNTYAKEHSLSTCRTCHCLKPVCDCRPKW
jgi:hypothetical protein